MKTLDQIRAEMGATIPPSDIMSALAKPPAAPRPAMAAPQVTPQSLAQGAAPSQDMVAAHKSVAQLNGFGENEQRAALAEYMKNGGVNLDPAVTAWCAGIVNAAAQQQGVEGTGSLMAKSFLNWGEGVDNPQKGDLVVFDRGSNPAQGHVAFFEGYNEDGSVRVTGGNQGGRRADGGSVTTANYPAHKIRGFRRHTEGQSIADATMQALGKQPMQPKSPNAASQALATASGGPQAGIAARQAMGGGPGALLPPQATSDKTGGQMPQKQEKQYRKGLLRMLGADTSKDGYWNDDRMDKVAIAVEGMRLDPNQGAISAASGRIAGRRQDAAAEKEALKQQEQINKTAEFLRSVGNNEMADAIQSGAIDGKTAFSSHMQQQQRQQASAAKQGQMNRTMEYLQQNRPDLAAQVQAGLPISEAFKMLNQEPDQVKGVEFEGNLVNPMTGELIAEGTQDGDPAWQQLTPEQVQARGLDANKAWQSSPDGQIKQVGSSGVVITNNLGADGAQLPKLQDGYAYARDPVTGEVIYEDVMQNGREVRRPIATPVGGTKADASIGTGKSLAQADQMLSTIDQVLNDPALDWGTGASSWTQNIPGTGAKRFGTRAAQLQGQAFLQAFDSLKGGGQITEVEGRKAEAAIGRLDTAQSADDYREALSELKDVINGAKQRIGSSGQASPTSGASLRYNPETGGFDPIQ